MEKVRGRPEAARQDRLEDLIHVMKGENDKKNPKRLFVRWVNGAQAPDATSYYPRSRSRALEEAKAVLCPLGSKSHPEF